MCLPGADACLPGRFRHDPPGEPGTGKPAAAYAGDKDAAQAALERAGEAGAEAIRAYIDAGVPPPNAPLTVEGGWIRNFSSKKPVHVEGKGFNKPLYNTGELYDDFDYEITERGSG